MSVTGKRIILTDANFADINISSEHYTLVSIAITTQPTKQTYTIGEAFDTQGMVVSATMTEDTTHETVVRAVTGYTYEPSDTFTTTGSKTITVSYTKGGVTKTATTTVTVTSGTVYNITGSITNGSLGGASTIASGASAVANIVPNSDYTYPSTVTVTGATYEYNSTTGAVTLSNPTGNVTITATCEENSFVNMTFLIGAYTWNQSSYAPNTNIRATWFGTLHSGDTLAIADNAKAGTQYQIVFSPLSGTTGHTTANDTVRQEWHDAGLPITGFPESAYTDLPLTMPAGITGRVAVTVKDANAPNTAISTSELSKILKIKWGNPSDPTNNPVSSQEQAG